MKEVWTAILGCVFGGIAAAIITWSTVQTHEYRLDKVEATFESHLRAHDEQNKEIRSTLMEIKEAIGRLSGREK